MRVVGTAERLVAQISGGDELSRAVYGCSASGAGEEAVVANAMEAAGQDVEEEAADELSGIDCLIQAFPGALPPAR